MEVQNEKKKIPFWFWIKKYISKTSEIILLGTKLIFFKKPLLLRERKKNPL